MKLQSQLLLGLLALGFTAQGTSLEENLIASKAVPAEVESFVAKVEQAVATGTQKVADVTAPMRKAISDATSPVIDAVSEATNPVIKSVSDTAKGALDSIGNVAPGLIARKEVVVAPQTRYAKAVAYLKNAADKTSAFANSQYAKGKTFVSNNKKAVIIAACVAAVVVVAVAAHKSAQARKRNQQAKDLESNDLNS